MAFHERPRGGLTPELAEWSRKITGFAKAYGLDFWEICFELLDYDEINEVAAYGGFPTRYPHWKFGMEYEQLSKGYTYGLQKIYELVINNDPCYAYLMKSNSLVDQKLVMAHVCGHADFFKNNLWFAKTNRKMIDEMANHGTKMRRYAEKYGHEEVERFIDGCLSIDNLIDMHSPFIKRRREKETIEEQDEPKRATPRKLRSKEYMDRYVNPPEFMEEQKKKLTEAIEKSKNFPEHPERDVLLFLIEHAPLERWQRDILTMVREEAYYFVPQAMTKIMNEGWACLARASVVFTDAGVVTMGDLVGGLGGHVFDGSGPRAVVDQHIIRDHETVEVRTRRGLKLVGSNNHRIQLPDGTWRRLDELMIGDKVAVSGGAGLWSQSVVELAWAPRRRMQLADAGQSGRETDARLAPREAFTIPRVVDESVGSFLGYLVGDGGPRTADDEQAEHFCELGRQLLGLDPSTGLEALSSEVLSELLTEGLGLTLVGRNAHEKRIPDAVLRSPEQVVRAFLRAYFDCDGYAGKQGVILSTISDALAEQVQLLLMNYGIITHKRHQTDGSWHVQATGPSAARFGEKIGFNLRRKQAALEAYVAEHSGFKEERWEDEVVSLERGRADVYDITVEETHRYAAGGFINHNSFWHSNLMTSKILTDDEVIDYADHHAGTMGSRPGVLNPYKVGIELFRDIEDRWNKGKFGAEWDECDDAKKKREWDRKLGKGREKIFEVRRIYNDILFIDEFLTEDFAKQQKMFTFEFSKQSGDYVIASREFKAIKEKLLFELTNWGNPFISVESGNYENRGELYLSHRHDGHDLNQEHAKDVLKNIQMIWNRPVHIETSVEKRRKVLSFNGRKHSERTL